MSAGSGRGSTTGQARRRHVLSVVWLTAPSGAGARHVRRPAGQDGRTVGGHRALWNHLRADSRRAALRRRGGRRLAADVDIDVGSVGPGLLLSSCDQPQSRVVPADAPERAERDHQHDTVQAAFEAPSSIDTSAASAMESVGLATGGTKNIENFRENVEVGYTPQLEAIGERGCSTTTTSRPVGRTPPTATPCSRPGTQRRSASIR